MKPIDFDNPNPLFGIITDVKPDELYRFRSTLQIFCLKYRRYFNIKITDGPFLSSNYGCLLYIGNLEVQNSPIVIDRLVRIEVLYPKFVEFKYLKPQNGCKVKIYTSKLT